MSVRTPEETARLALTVQRERARRPGGYAWTIAARIVFEIEARMLAANLSGEEV